MEKLRLNLQLFADGGGGAAGGDGGAAAGAGDATGVQVPDAGEQRQKKRVNPLANTKYGIQPQQAEAQGEVAATTEAAANSANQAEEKKSFEDLIKGEYKADFDARVQEIIRNRFKQNGEMEEKLNAMNPLMEALGKMYNVDPTDIQQLTNVVMDNDSLYEEEALQRGMSVDTLKSIKQMEREHEQMKQREQQTIAEQRMRQHFDGLARQVDAVKQLYPSFDLMTEMQNPEFARLTAPGVNVDVRTAYEVVHREEMRGAEMQFAAQKSAERVANAVRANGMRPAENGMNSQQAASPVKSDPRTLTKADLAEISRRVARGEKIAF
jgi:hypothetical protein